MESQGVISPFGRKANHFYLTVIGNLFLSIHKRLRII